MTEVFISYAREDGATAQQLSRQLQQAGFGVFLDVERMRAGSFPEQLDRAIARSDVFLLLLSPASVRSTYVQRELHDAADEHLKPVLPVMLADTDLTPVRLTIAGLQRVPYDPDRPDTLAAVVDGIHRLAASKRRERRQERGPLQRLGTVVAVIGTLMIVGGFLTFIGSILLTANSEPGDTSVPPALLVGFGVFAVGIFVAAGGTAMRNYRRQLR